MARPSIRRHLLARLLITVTLTVAVAIALVYLYAGREVNSFFDAKLVQQATVLGVLLNHEASEEQKRAGEMQRLLKELGPEALKRSPLFASLVEKNKHTAEHKDYLKISPLTYRKGHRYETEINFFVRYSSGQIMIRSPGTTLFEVQGNGFQTRNRGGDEWRVYTLIMPDSHLLVQLSQRIALRQEAINAMLDRAFWPLLIMMPVLGLIIWRGVGGELAQLSALANSLEKRDPRSLELISVRGLPQEVVPMVVALNHLFSRVDAAMENEHRFTSDAAHELRNPLAVLKTQVQVFEMTADTPEQQHFVHSMLKGIDRIGRLLEQLLMLARADIRQRETSYSELDLFGVCESVLAERGQAALDKAIELSLEGQRIMVPGDYTAMSMLVGNLVDNAIHYTPAGGQVAVRLLQTTTSLEMQVEDDGPGIPPEQREALFERFRRGGQRNTAGSGLGLSIVRQIAELHNARVELETAPGGHGLLVRVVFDQYVSS